MTDYLRALLHRSDIGRSRSSITNPLQWALVILIGGIAAASEVHASAWIVSAMVIVFLVVVGLFLYAYIFFMHTNPDALRSEQFTLAKLAIEKQLIGDSVRGLIEQVITEPASQDEHKEEQGA